MLRDSHGKIILVSSGAAVSAYATWGCYGASKAVLNHLATTLAVEEPNVTTISIRPGTVDTEMQRELREIHNTAMDKADAEKFASLKSTGKLLRPDQPGNVLAKLAVRAPNDLNGKFLKYVPDLRGMSVLVLIYIISWNDSALSAVQES